MFDVVHYLDIYIKCRFEGFQVAEEAHTM